MTITVQGEVDEQGRLHLNLPPLPAGRFTVTITSEPLITPEKEAELGYPPGWFERVAGSLADVEYFERPQQGEFEEREPLD